MSRNGKLTPYEKGIKWSQKVRNILDTMSQEESTKISSVGQSNSNFQESEDDDELIMSSQPEFVPPKSKRTMAPSPSGSGSKKPRVGSTSLVQQTSAQHQNDVNERQKILLDLQIEEKKVDLEIKRTLLQKEQLQCHELKLKIEQLEKIQHN